MGELIVGMIVYISVTLLGVAGILLARALLIPAGSITISVNRLRTFEVPRGGKLLGALSENEIFVSAACGGTGVCGQCKVKVLEGGGVLLPTERMHIDRPEERAGVRLACQVAVKESLEVEVPRAALEARRWICQVRSNRNVATYIKELVLDLPPGEEVSFEPGQYIEIHVQPHDISFRDFDIDEEYRDDWTTYGLWNLRSQLSETISRAYSLANYTEEKGTIKLNVRIATPPPQAPTDVPPGRGSSYLFNLKPGDPVTISGPYGEFHIQETDAEMVYIGGGAGMAPLRSHIFELFKGRHTERLVSYWYGARSQREVFYEDEFEELAREHDNFSFHLALSEPLSAVPWSGPVGFIHQVVFDEYLQNHRAPEEVEYYVCGPPMMSAAVLHMLDSLGVDPDNIFFDEFGV